MKAFPKQPAVPTQSRVAPPSVAVPEVCDGPVAPDVPAPVTTYKLPPQARTVFAVRAVVAAQRVVPVGPTIG